MLLRASRQELASDTQAVLASTRSQSGFSPSNVGHMARTNFAVERFVVGTFR